MDAEDLLPSIDVRPVDRYLPVKSEGPPTKTISGLSHNLMRQEGAWAQHVQPQVPSNVEKAIPENISQAPMLSPDDIPGPARHMLKLQLFSVPSRAGTRVVFKPFLGHAAEGKRKTGGGGKQSRQDINTCHAAKGGEKEGRRWKTEQAGHKHIHSTRLHTCRAEEGRGRGCPVCLCPPGLPHLRCSQNHPSPPTAG